MSSSNQPYSFGDVRGVVAKAGEKATGYFKKKTKEAAGDKAFNEKLYTMAAGSAMKTEAEKELMKAKGKQERKTAKAKAKAETKSYGKRLAHNVASAQQMTTVAKPGSGVSMSERSFSFTTPAAPKAAPASKSKATAPKPKPSLARRAQMGKAMRKKGL